MFSTRLGEREILRQSLPAAISSNGWVGNHGLMIFQRLFATPMIGKENFRDPAAGGKMLCCLLIQANGDSPGSSSDHAARRTQKTLVERQVQALIETRNWLPIQNSPRLLIAEANRLELRFEAARHQQRRQFSLFPK